MEEAARVDASGVFDALDELLGEIAHLEIEISDRRRFGFVGLLTRPGCDTVL